MSSAGRLGIPVPAVLSKGAGLRVLDYRDDEKIAHADATGTAVLQYGYLSQDHIWRVERVVVQADPPSTAECLVTVYVADNAIAQRARDWTPLPPGLVAVAEYPSFLTVRPSNLLQIVVTGANPGDTFMASCQYQLVQQVIGQASWPSS